VFKDVYDFGRLQTGVNWRKYGSGRDDTVMGVLERFITVSVIFG
jgi:hypothetical protein